MEPLFFNIVDEHLFCRGDNNFRSKKNAEKGREGRQKKEERTRR